MLGKVFVLHVRGCLVGFNVLGALVYVREKHRVKEHSHENSNHK